MKPTDISSPVAYATLPTTAHAVLAHLCRITATRLLIINVKMLRLIAKSHTPPPPHPEEKPAQQDVTQ